MAAELMMMNVTGTGMVMTTAAGLVAKRHRMWMWYHARIEDTVLFKQWTVFDIGTLIWTCFVIIAAGILLESIKYFRWVAKEKMKATHPIDTDYGGMKIPIRKTEFAMFSNAHLVQTVFHFFQLLLAYLLMNVYMVFSIWICLSLCLGLTIGHFIFASRISS